jgi:hypothetical protein
MPLPLSCCSLCLHSPPSPAPGDQWSPFFMEPKGTATQTCGRRVELLASASENLNHQIYMYVNVCYISIYMFASCSCGSFGQKVKYLCISNTQISNYLTVQQCTYLSISIDLSFYSSIHRVQTGVQPVPTDWCPNGWDDWTRTDGFLGRYGSIYWVPK